MRKEQFVAIAILWVGGWGVLFLDHPLLVCRIFRQKATPQRLKLIHIIGAVALGMLITGLVCVAIFGLTWD
jgi:hypothetical protein